MRRLISTINQPPKRNQQKRGEQNQRTDDLIAGKTHNLKFAEKCFVNINFFNKLRFHT